MSAVTQIVFHPSISQSLRVLSTTAGREKTYRAIQYFARFYAWLLLKRGSALPAAQWNALKSTLASGRKLLQLFKPVEHLQAALSAPSVYQTEYLASVARQLSYAGYLAFDSVVWANSIRFISLDKDVAGRVNRIAQRLWLAGIVFSIGGGLSKLNRQSKWPVRTEIAVTRYQLVQDLLDLWLPASALGYVGLGDGIVGILGLVTSLMSLNLQWKAVAGAKK